MPSPPVNSNHSLARRVRQLWREDIWHYAVLEDRTRRGRCYGWLRVLSITAQGTVRNKIFSQAAALAYSSLLSLGPIVSLAIILASFVLQKNSDHFASDFLDQVVTFIAPDTSEFSRQELLNQEKNTAANSTATPGVAPENGAPTNSSAANPSITPVPTVPPPAGDGTTANPATVPAKNFSPRIVKMLDHLVDSAKSKTVGALGLLVLIFICIQLIISVENTFNGIWGVHRGRDMVHRVVLYWSVFSLAVLVAFTAGTVLSASTLSKFFDHLPWGLDMLNLRGMLPHFLSFILLTALLGGFYRFIPNTTVRWMPAVSGGAVIALCLVLNNYLSFLYVRQVLSAQSLYGSIGIIPVLMFGLYIFWMLILLGGQFTFAVQNANALSDERLWTQVSPRTRRMLSLAVFLQICRAFVRRSPGPASDELVERLRVPANLINESLTRLTELQLLTTVEMEDAAGHMRTRYQPGRPLHQLTLGEFQRTLDAFGNTGGESILNPTDPVLNSYLESLTAFEDGPALHKNFAELLADETVNNPVNGVA